MLGKPVIVVVANSITQWDLPVGWKVLLITTISFGLSVGIYRFLVYPFGFMRLIFGMKPGKSGNKLPIPDPEALIPVSPS